MLLKFLKDKKNAPMLIIFLLGIVGVTIGSYNGNYNGLETLPKDKTLKNIDD